MENTAFIALSRQGALRRKMDIVANNIANMNTNGFKGERMMFVDHVMKSKGGHSIFGDKIAYVRDVATRIDLSEGPLKATGNPWTSRFAAMAFSSSKPRKANGIRATAVWNSTRGTTGQRGRPAHPFGCGRAILPRPGRHRHHDFEDGTVDTNNGAIGRLRVVRFENPQLLERLPGGLFQSDAAPLDAEDREVVQGMLEGSNVNGIREITKMIDVHRSYDRIRKVAEDESERIRKMMEAYRVNA